MLLDEFKKEFDKLNDEQKQAVEILEWPIMVVAWPWTWKTQIIWLRTANIILKTWVNPENILITTFTDAWVIAIRKRLIKFLWNDAYKVWVSTIHSFCQDILKTFPEKFLEYKASYAIDDVDITEILKQIIDKLYDGKKLQELVSDYDRYFYLMDIKSRISTLKQEWISKTDFIKSISNQREIYDEELLNIKPKKSWELPKKYEKDKEKYEKHINKLNELLLIYEEYNNYLRQNSLYDFNDMINFVLEKFKQDDDLSYYYSEKYQYIMLDEYQDTNNPQNTIIDIIMERSISSHLTPNIMVVWDDDQSIYRFQWANIENMLDFSIKYKDTKIIVLKNNYRSNQEILDLCTSSIENNNERLSVRVSSIKKELISWIGKKSNSKPKMYNFLNPNEEKSFILSQIKEKISTWVPKEEVAIIVRNNREVEEFSLFLEQNWIEVTSKLNTDILSNNFVNLIIKILRVIKDPYEHESDFIDILRTKIIWLNQIDVFKISRKLFILNYSKKIKIRFFDYFLEFENSEDLELKDKEKILEFRQKFLDLQDDLSILNLQEFLNSLINKVAILEYIEKNWTFDDIEDIYTLMNKINDFSLKLPWFNLDKLISKLELFKKYNFKIPRQILKKEKKWVQVLTAHSSKWLEYKTVFIPWLVTWVWDNKRVIDKIKLPLWLVWNGVQLESDPIEEDRRLFFVACSRAKDELYLSFPSWKDNKVFLKSVFLEEVLGHTEFFENYESKENIETSIINILKNDLIDYSDNEFSYIEEFLENYKLSPTDLNLFLEDPLLFLNNVIFKYPFVDNEATIFGKVYHRVLELFYSKYKENWILEKKSYLTWTFKLLLEKEFLTLEQREKLLERWINWLEWFYETYKNNSRKVLYVEYDFRNRWIFFEWVPLTWKIDKIEIEWNSNFSFDSSEGTKWQLTFFKEKISLIDYKTWKPKSIWEIKWIDKNWNKKPWEWKYFRQVLFYKLLAWLDHNLSTNYIVNSLALDFVEWKNWEYKYVEIDFHDEDMENLKVEILNSWQKIKDINFWKNLLKK